MDEYYKILGVSPDADDAEIETAYQNLKAKYSRERFEDGEVGNNAAKNRTKLNEAYEEIIEARKYVSNSNNDKNRLITPGMFFFIRISSNFSYSQRTGKRGPDVSIFFYLYILV